MRKMNIWKWVLAVCFVLTVGTEADAQDWKSILGGVVNAVTDGNTSLTGKNRLKVRGLMQVLTVSLPVTICWLRPGEKWLQKRLKAKWGIS